MARITPAGAGKTFSSKRSNANCEDHPRRCGENLFVPDGQEIADGSPPQVRGKQLFTGKLNSNFRITPAGAGKTPPKARFIPLSQDHPRRCGENLSAGITRKSVLGSPPQVRACTRVSICYLIVGNLTCFKTTLFFQMGLQIFRHLITQHVQAIIICTLNG